MSTQGGATLDPVTLSQVIQAHIQLFRSLQIYVVAMFSVLVWDYMVTVRAEYLHIWPSRFTAVKLCFFANRYLTLACMAFILACAFSEYLTTHCSRVHWLQAYVPIVIFLCCNYKLAHRCSALFTEPKPVFRALLVVVVTQAAVQAGVSVKNKPVQVPPGMTGCYSLPDSEYGFCYWLFPLITNLIILIITVVKIYQYWSAHGRTHLLSIFVSDGLVYFSVAAAVNVVNVVYMKSKVIVNGISINGGSFNSAMALVVTSCMVSRLIIHMRVALADETTVAYQAESHSKRVPVSPSRRNSYSIKAKGAFSSPRRTLSSRDKDGVHVVDVDLATFPPPATAYMPKGDRSRPSSTYAKDESYGESDNASDLDGEKETMTNSDARLRRQQSNSAPGMAKFTARRTSAHRDLAPVWSGPAQEQEPRSTSAPVGNEGDRHQGITSSTGRPRGNTGGLANAITVTTERVIVVEQAVTEEDLVGKGV